MTLSTGLCRELAALARLSLSDEEAALFSGQLKPVLTYLEQLQSVDIAGIEEEVVGVTPVPLRVDEPSAQLDAHAALAGAKRVRGGHIVVPKFKED